MFVFDSTGLFSLVCLVVQCGLAWIFFGLLLVLVPRGEKPRWLECWCTAYLGLAVGLSALSVRYLMLEYYSGTEHWLEDGHVPARLLAAVYLGGKIVFLWHLVGGTAALRARAWPAVWRPWGVGALTLAALVGYLAPAMEFALLVQAPVMVAGALYAARLLWPLTRERADVGNQIVWMVLWFWAAAWVVYGTCAFMVSPIRPDLGSLWGYPLRMNSMLDLLLQVVLGAGLIIVALQDARHAMLMVIKDRDRLRQRLQQDEKLRALSTLVGGVAHELNNPLTAVIGFADELLHDEPEVRATAARIVREQAERCRGIVQRLSAYARGVEIERAAIDLEELCGRVARGLLPQLAAARVRLERPPVVLPRPLYGDATAVEQVLSNLICNAMQASPQGGTIRLLVAAGESGVSITVDDSGPGVPAALRERVFEPFFTTKDPGRGTGLGLSVASSLVRAHGGTIAVEDAPQGGARFVVRLPWNEPGLVLPSRAPAPALTRPLHLLVVDDEDAVRQSIVRHARSAGWQATDVASAEAALRLLLDEGKDFDVVLCDLRMPGMSGAGFHDRIATVAPRWLTRLVFISGDSDSAESLAFAARCRAPVLGKPFVFQELLERLRQVAVSV